MDNSKKVIRLVDGLRDHPQYWQSRHSHAGWRVLRDHYGKKLPCLWNVNALEEIVCLAYQVLKEG